MKYHTGPPKPNSALFPAEEAEAAVCAYLIQRPERHISEALDANITEEKFSNEVWRHLFTLIMEFHRAGRAGELHAEYGYVFISELKRRGLAKAFGPNCHLVADLWAKYCTYADAFEMWLFQMNDTYARRLTAERMEGSIEDVSDPSVSNPEAAASLIDAARFLEESVNADSDTFEHPEVLEAIGHELILRQQGDSPALLTGMDRLDDAVGGGLMQQSFWVFGAPSGGGKTAIMLQIAGSIMRQGARVLVFSMEMTRKEVTKRIWASTYGCDYELLGRTSGKATKGELAEVVKGIEAMKRDNPDIHINERGMVTIDYIWAEVERLRPQLVVVDYLQLLDMAGRKDQGREERIFEACRQLKALAKEQNTAVITASQLNDDGKLYGARSIRFHGDAVFIVAEDGSGIWVDKVRGREKPSEPLPLRLNGRYQRFE